MKEFNQYQFEDLLVRESDFYTQNKDRIILDFLKGREPSKILEVGCGSGELSFSLADLGHNVTGIDLVQEYIELAKKRSAPKNGKCVFYAMNLNNFSSEKDFDVIVAMDVLEHIENDKTAARKLASLLRPDGELIVTVPAHSWLFGFHDKALGHFRRYGKKSLRDLISNTGLVDIKNMRYFGFTLVPICLLYSRLLRRPYPKTSLGDARGKTVLGFVAGKLLDLDRRLALMPFGISLVLHGKKRL